MSKRLNKRQQRELEELEMLKAAEQTAAQAGEAEENSEEEEVEDVKGNGVVNAFAALGPEDVPEVEDDEEEEEEAPTAAPKKSKKKKHKKKKSTAATPQDIGPDAEEGSTPATPARKSAQTNKGAKGDPLDGMDEVDRALAELDMKYGEAGPSSTSKAPGNESSPSSVLYRQLLSVDPKNLDADAELRRFFGSKVIAGGANTSKSHRPTPSAKLRYTLSKPKAQYPPATSLGGLTMREMTDQEVEDVIAERADPGDEGERWFTFEHAMPWREITRQFLGAVRSHDPNELMALLQVYPWHVDTLLQMSEVYRLQSDIGAASDYAERALYAFDRCLAPSFNVSSGACRVDFTRVENRPLFTAIHRIISYLGRRGCWVTAFNFAKLLFALDPLNDPHGAAFWLDFLAIKSNNHAWMMELLEAKWAPAAFMRGYPGMAYARALALRAQEESEKSKNHSSSDQALLVAMTQFPSVIPLLADKINASFPDAARSNPLLQIEAGYIDEPTNPIHLLSHIYVSRSEALWKEASRLTWFESMIPRAIASLGSPEAKAAREEALFNSTIARDPLDETMNTPLHLCRHVLCGESTAWIGFLPPKIRNVPFHAFDPLPPSNAVSAYDDEYFVGVAKRAGGRGRGRGGEMGMGGGAEGFMREFMETVREYPNNWRDRLAEVWGRRVAGIPGVAAGERQQNVNQLLDLFEGMLPELQARGDRMPGAFPADPTEDSD